MTASDDPAGQANRTQSRSCPSSIPARRKRSCGRMGVEVEARLRLCGQGHRHLRCQVTDVCLGGLCVTLGEAPPRNGSVLVELCLSTPGECHVLPGRLSWARPEGSGWRAGIELPDETSWAWFAALRQMMPVAAAL